MKVSIQEVILTLSACAAMELFALSIVFIPDAYGEPFLLEGRYTVTYKDAGRLQRCRTVGCFIRRTGQSRTDELIYIVLPRRDKRAAVTQSCLGTQGIHYSKQGQRARLSKCIAIGQEPSDKVRSEPETISELEAFANGLELDSWNSNNPEWMEEDIVGHWSDVMVDEADHQAWCAKHRAKKKELCNAEFSVRAPFQRVYKGPNTYALAGIVKNTRW